MAGFTQILKGLAKAAGKKPPTAKQLNILDLKADATYTASEMERAANPKLKANSIALANATRNRLLNQNIIDENELIDPKEITRIIKAKKFEKVGAGKDPKLNEDSSQFQRIMSEFKAGRRATKAQREGTMDVGNVRAQEYFAPADIDNPVTLSSRIKTYGMAKIAGKAGVAAGLAVGIPIGGAGVIGLQSLYNRYFSGEAPSRFSQEFAKAVKEGKTTFFYTNDEGVTQEIEVAIAAEENPDIKFVPTIREKNNEGGVQKGDLNKDGKLSSYEETRQNAIEESMSKRQTAQEGGEMTMPPELMQADVPVDTYPNATPEELEAADQRPDAEMEDNYIEFILSESLSDEEQSYLMNALETDPQLSMIFDKVIDTASEFSGAGEVDGPGDGLSDSIPARLSDGEFVMTKKATDQIGADNLQIMMDEAERAYDGGMMRQQRQLGGLMADEEATTTMTGGLDQDLMKAMSLKANKAPSLS